MQLLLTVFISACALIVGPAWSQPQPPKKEAERPAAVVKQEPKKVAKQEDPGAVIKKIANEDSVGGAATLVSDLLKTDSPAAKRAICDLFKAPSTSDVVYEAICGVLARRPSVAEDPEALQGFGHGLARPSSRVQDVVRGSLRRLDAGEGALLKLALKEILSKETEEPAKESFVRIAAELAQSKAVDRLEATEAFIAALAAGPSNGYRLALANGLQTLTYRRFQDAAKANAWLSEFLKNDLGGNRFGFTHRKLLETNEADRLKSMSAEAKNSLDRLIGAGILPKWYLSSTDYPDPLIRIKALDGIEQIAGNNEALRRETVPLLLGLVEQDDDEAVQVKAINGLARAATVLKSDLKLRQQISVPLLQLLKEGSQELAKASAMGLARCYIATTGKPLAARYAELKDKPSQWPVRREIILALTELKQHPETVLLGLVDQNSEVRQVAGRSLSRFQIKGHAGSLAKAWDRETKNPEIRRTYLLTIEQLGNYADEGVISTLIKGAELKGLGQEDALRSLLKSLRASDDLAPTEALAQKVIEFLGRHVPANVPTDARQGLYTNELKASPPPNVARVALLWAQNESEISLRTLAAEAVLRGHESLPLPSLLPLTAQLLTPADPLSPTQPATAPTGLRLLEALEVRAKLPNAPEAESKLLPTIQLRIADALILSKDPKSAAEAAQRLTALLKTTPKPTTPSLLIKRAQAYIQGSQPKLAAKDLDSAQSLLTEATKPKLRKQLALQRANLSFLTNHPKQSLAQATQALTLPGDTPALTSQLHILILKSALQTYDLKALTPAPASLTALEQTHPNLLPTYQPLLQLHLQTLTHLTTITTPESQTFLTTQPTKAITPYLLHTLRQALTNPTPESLLPPLTLLHHHHKSIPLPDPKSPLPTLKLTAEQTLTALSK